MNAYSITLEGGGWGKREDYGGFSGKSDHKEGYLPYYLSRHWKKIFPPFLGKSKTKIDQIL